MTFRKFDTFRLEDILEETQTHISNFEIMHIKEHPFRHEASAKINKSGNFCGCSYLIH